MFITVFRSGYLTKIIMFLGVSVLLWLPAFLNPPVIPPENTFGILFDLLIEIPWLQGIIPVIAAFILLIVQALIFNAVMIENPVFSKSVFLPALIYVVLMSYNPDYLTLTPVLIANFLMVLSLKNLYSSYSKADAFKEAFNASFWVALAALFYLPSIFMMLLIWTTFIIFRISAWREWVISLIAVVTPFVMFFVIFYLTGRIEFLQEYYPSDFSWIQTQLSITRSDMIFWPVFLVLLSVATYRFLLGQADKIISIRKGFAVINAYYIISAAGIFFSGPNPHQHALMIFPAAAAIISYYFIESRKLLMAEILFILLLSAIVVIKFV